MPITFSTLQCYYAFSHIVCKWNVYHLWCTFRLPYTLVICRWASALIRNIKTWYIIFYKFNNNKIYYWTLRSLNVYLKYVVCSKKRPKLAYNSVYVTRHNSPMSVDTLILFRQSSYTSSTKMHAGNWFGGEKINSYRGMKEGSYGITTACNAVYIPYFMCYRYSMPILYHC
jgi:hypothetical protein